MATEVVNNVPSVTEKEPKEEAAVDNGQKDEKQDENAAVGEKTAEEPASKAEAPAKLNVRKTNFEKDTVYLYQFGRTPVIPSLSSYCLKVETWLRMAGVKYENVDHKMKFRSRKGQLPFIELNGEEIPDSAIIIKELTVKCEKDLDAGLSTEQRNVSHAMISMIEHHLTWVVFWWRTKYPDSLLKGYKVNLQTALGTRLPNFLLNLCFKFAFSRRWLQGAKKVKAQGIGVHSQEEIIEFGTNDLRVLSNVLGEKPFFFGEEPTNLDVAAFAILAQLQFLDKEVEHPLRDVMESEFANLVGLVNRMKERCFPDWDDICATLDMNSHLPKPVKETKEKEGKDTKDKEAKEKEVKDTKEGDKTEEAGANEEKKDAEEKKLEPEEKEVEKEEAK